jgi:4-amino-4-deoxy-L-arabinose transferase-like glycosyltransferase
MSSARESRFVDLLHLERWIDERRIDPNLASWLVILIVSAAILLPGLNATRFWDQDEGYYASVAYEMHQRDDWIVPTFNGELFAHKPPMMYWGMRAGFHLFGVNEFGGRFFGAIAGVITILVTYRLASKLFDSAVGILAALGLATCILFSMVARSATADTYLCMFTVLALHHWVCAYRKDLDRTVADRLHGVAWKDWFVVYSYLGFAVLTKGPIGFLFPTAVIGLFLLMEKAFEHQTQATFQPDRRVGMTRAIRRRGSGFNQPEYRSADAMPLRFFGVQPGLFGTWLPTARLHALGRILDPLSFLRTCLAMKLWVALLALAWTAVPWFILVEWKSNGLFLEEFIGVHHWGRFHQAMDNHRGSILYYPAVCLVGLFPWSSFAIPTTIHWLRSPTPSSDRSPLRFVTAWILVYLGIFSFASTKLPNYVLPAYPALLMVIAYYFKDSIVRDRTHRRWQIAGWLFFSLVGVTLVAFLSLVPRLEISGRPLLDLLEIAPSAQSAIGSLWLIGVPIAILGMFGLYLVWNAKPRMAIVCFISASIAFTSLLWQYGARIVDRLQAPQLAAAQLHAAGLSSGIRLTAINLFRPSMVFYLGNPIHFETDRSIRENHYGVPSSTSEYLILGDHDWEQLHERFGNDYRVIMQLPNFPEKGNLLVVSNAPSSQSLASRSTNSKSIR